MQAYVSLWSADLLDIGRAIDRVEQLADGFHLDVFDGHDVDDLLFGPDFAAAVRKRTAKTIDVHLNVTEPDHWVERFADVGADMITVRSGRCLDVAATLARIRERGLQASLGVEVHEDLHGAIASRPAVDRFLLMGTPIGIKGVDMDPRTPDRVRQLKAAPPPDVPDTTAGPVVFVDGGIRAGTTPMLAAAGADGVIPGSLVYGDPDPAAAVQRLHDLGSE